VLVHLLGGDLTIEVEPEDGPDASSAGAAEGAGGYRVFMTGPAAKVCECELSGEFLRRVGWPADGAH
jgi:hypothetical protein